jgi:hypothetical protein
VTRSSRAGRSCRVATALLTVVLVPLAAAAPALAFTEPVAAPLASPTGLTPNDTSFPRTALKTVDLHWGPVTGATGYSVEIGTDETWSDDPVYTGSTYNTTLTVPTWLPHGTYVWRVAAMKNATPGHWSSEETHSPAAERDAQFTRGWTTTPTTLSPATGANASARPEFSWTPVDQASAYEVQVSEDPGFPAASTTQQQTTAPTDYCFTSRTRVTAYTAQGSSEKDNPGACNWAHLGQGAGVQLYWRVRALDRLAEPSVDGATTPVSTSGVPSQGPSTTPNDPELVSDCPGQSGCDPTHESELSRWSAPVPFTSADYVTPAGAYDEANQVVTDPLRSDDPDNVCTATTANGVLPEHADCTDFPTLHWAPVAGAVRYRVIVGLDEDFSNIALMAESSGLSWTPTEAWRDSTPGQSYFYAVQACVVDRCGSVTATPSSFTKKSPRSTIASAVPAKKGPFALSWNSYASALSDASDLNATGDAFEYHLQIATSAHPSFDTTVDDVLLDSTTFYPTKSYADGDFVWRVQAVNGSGHKLPWSYSQAFTRDTTAPKAVSVSPSARVGTKTPVKVVFSEVVTGLSSSSLTATLDGVALPATVSLGADGKTATLTPTKAYVAGATYAVKVGSAVTDAAGNVAVAAGPSFAVTPFLDDINGALTYSAGWARLMSSNANGGTFHQTSGVHTVTTAFRGTAIAVTGCLSPNGGLVDLNVGSITKRVNTYRSYSGCGVVLAKITGLTRSKHTLKITALGRHTAASKGNQVGFDSASITP